MVYRAARDIEPGEQILVNYEWAPGEFDIPPPRPRRKPRPGGRR
jgi:SET domain-containing protein